MINDLLAIKHLCGIGLKYQTGLSIGRYFKSNDSDSGGENVIRMSYKIAAAQLGLVRLICNVINGEN